MQARRRQGHDRPELLMNLRSFAGFSHTCRCTGPTGPPPSSSSRRLASQVHSPGYHTRIPADQRKSQPCDANGQLTGRCFRRKWLSKTKRNAREQNPKPKFLNQIISFSSSDCKAKVRPTPPPESLFTSVQDISTMPNAKEGDSPSSSPPHYA